jgi:glutamine---fructose-6-phosphate transaminase (isomerizing)
MRRFLQTELEKVWSVARALGERRIRYVLVAARGSSDHAGVYAQYLFGARNHLPVALATPSLFTVYAQPPNLTDALVIGISQSGQSPDIVGVVAEGRRQGAATLAITNDPTSPLAQAAEFALDICAGREKAVAATKTYTAQLLALAALSVALDAAGAEAEADLESIRRVPGAAEAALELDREAERIAHEHASLSRCIVVGRGYNYASAQEWALKLKEMAYVFSDVYSTADFQHGPIAIIEEGFPVLAVAPSGVMLAHQLPLLSRLRDQYGARLLLISDDGEALEMAQRGLRLPVALPEWLSPLAAIVPAQLYCYHLTRAKGYSTEQPRSLQKVTLTE